MDRRARVPLQLASGTVYFDSILGTVSASRCRDLIMESCRHFSRTAESMGRSVDKRFPDIDKPIVPWTLAIVHQTWIVVVLGSCLAIPNRRLLGNGNPLSADAL